VQLLQLQENLPCVEKVMSVALNDDIFAKFVAEEVKNKLSPLHRQELMKQENWERWREALGYLSRNLQEQLDSIDADAGSDASRYLSMGRDGKHLAVEAKKAYDFRSKKISRFKFHVDKRLDEVSAMIETGTEIINDGWDKVEFYKNAIFRHREMLREFDLEETAIDRALWATLGDRWLFDDIDVDNL